VTDEPEAADLGDGDDGALEPDDPAAEAEDLSDESDEPLEPQ
jgi:hypothetical protein